MRPRRRPRGTRNLSGTIGNFGLAVRRRVGEDCEVGLLLPFPELTWERYGPNRVWRGPSEAVTNERRRPFRMQGTEPSRVAIRQQERLMATIPTTLSEPIRVANLPLP